MPGRARPSDDEIGEGQRWITETTHTELADKVHVTHLHEVNARYKTLYFNDLYRQSPAICPTYYWFILNAYNPANVGVREFLEEYFHSRALKGMPLSGAEQATYEVLRRSDPRGIDVDPLGKPKTDEYRQLEKLEANLKRKAKQSVRNEHPTLLNDIRSFSLAMYYMLTTRQDMVFYTGDGDIQPLMLKWLDSVAMRMVLLREVAERLNERIKDDLYKKKVFEFKLDYATVMTKRQLAFIKLIETPINEPAVRFTMRRWNWRTAQFEGDYWLTFSEKEAQQISSMHGNFWCKYSQNDEFLNWVRIVYELTVGDVSKEIVVRVTSKALVIWNELGHTVLHQCQCRYRRDDASGGISKWSDFI